MIEQINLPQRQQKLQKFLNKYKKHLNKQIKQIFTIKQNQTQLLSLKSQNLNKIKCTIISDCDEEQLKLAAKRLNSGQLVSFPTQTVYGLGANALNDKALRKIYETKKRPLSDPIIVHILHPQDALKYKYVQITDKQMKYFDLLSKQFWPGPLTVILKANLQVLPLVVTAQTGFVGIRCPNHPYFRKLLAESKLPIGAPSANLFSHVSPSQAVHVFNDFYKDDVWIVDGGKCQFGIQSTVLKILDDQIKIFRQGSLSLNKIQDFFFKTLGQNAPKIQIVKKTAHQTQNTQAPGQLLKHYSPNIPCSYAQNQDQLKILSDDQLNKIGFISFSNELYGKISNKYGVYFQVGKTLSIPQQIQNKEQQKFCTFEQKIKMRQIYYLLRQLQNQDLNEIIIGWSGQKQGTIWDKIFRATQGRKYSKKQ